MSATLREQVEFNGFTLQTVDAGEIVYYVLWRGDDVVARGSADTVLRSARNPVEVDYTTPRDWEPPDYYNV